MTQRRKIGLVLALTALLTSTILTTEARAQRPAPDATPGQIAADVVSWATVGTQVGLDLYHAAKQPNWRCTVPREGLKLLLAGMASESLKALIHRQRPNGQDWKDVPSGHTVFAGAARGWSVGFGIALELGTGLGRRAANEHDWTGVTAGVGIGEFAGWLGGTLLPCK